MNPFDPSINKDCLFNISSGKCAPPEVVEYLLSVEKIGTDRKNDFLSKCSDDIQNFEKLTIKRVPVKNFTTTINRKVKTLKTKLKVLKVQTNMFGQLLRIALENKVDMAKVMINLYFENCNNSVLDKLIAIPQNFRCRCLLRFSRLSHVYWL